MKEKSTRGSRRKCVSNPFILVILHFLSPCPCCRRGFIVLLNIIIVSKILKYEYKKTYLGLETHMHLEPLYPPLPVPAVDGAL